MFVDCKSRRRINTSEKYGIDCVCTAHRCLLTHRHWHALSWKICFSNPCYEQAVVTGWETKAGRNLSQWIIESADLQPIKMLILSNELFPVLREWVVLHCALHHTARNWLLTGVWLARQKARYALFFGQGSNSFSFKIIANLLLYVPN